MIESKVVEASCAEVLQKITYVFMHAALQINDRDQLRKELESYLQAVHKLRKIERLLTDTLQDPALNSTKEDEGTPP